MGGYEFSLCNNGIATIPFVKVLPGWNRLEISARGSHFVFYINGQQVYVMDDDRQKVGALAVVIEMNEKASAKVAFDNFGYQPH